MCALVVSSASTFSPDDTSESSHREIVSTSPDLSIITKYMISSRQASKSSWIFYTRDPFTFKPLAMKVLRPYSDTRYQLSTMNERQRCQIEAFQQNRIFTPEVYLGLARVYNQPSEEDNILIGEIIQYPIQAPLEREVEYALIMERLPDHRRLDQLLVSDEHSIQKYLVTLTSHIVDLHKYRTLSLLPKESIYWGSYSQLKHKLEENLAFLSLILDNVDFATKATIELLSSGLRAIFTEEHYGCILEQRVRAGSIKHCHGDIKALNVWIMDASKEEYQQHQSVKLLDAIDFNSLFCNIDVLSDYAMLVLDIEARTKSTAFACTMIDFYLQLTNQDDTPTRAIFEYYLIEKAIVAATLNILFDNQFELGLRMLELAQKRLNYLSRRLLYQLV